MKKDKQHTRRKFIKKLGTTSAVFAAGTSVFAGTKENHKTILYERPERYKFSANDQIQLACIGTGGMGFGDINTALKVEGVKLTAVCDLYDGRLKRAKEVYGNDIQTTRDYREILNDSSVDAVIIATSDHWHEKIAVEAIQKGKAVYCEKPMTQKIEEGHNIINAHQKNKVAFQVGSQYVSNIAYKKAKELLDAGEIGNLNFIEAYFDRQSAIGAWQYSIPLDASPETIGWDAFLGHAPKRPFDAKRFFRWRNYQDYGTGIPGDLFVHLFSGIHLITGSHGPERIMATGGLRFWDDERDVADVMLGLYDYAATDKLPAHNVAFRVNFADGSGGGSKIRLVGSEGEMEINWDKVTLRRKRMPKAPGMSIGTFAEDQQEAFKKHYMEKYGKVKYQVVEPTELEYKVPEDYGWDGMRYQHFQDFFEVARKGGQTIEGPDFGLRAAGPALATNISHYEKKMISWDPKSMKVLSV